MSVWCFVCLCWLAIIQATEGVDLSVNPEAIYHPMGSNLTISCGETNGDIDWQKDESHLSSCTLNSPALCIPEGKKYTLDLTKQRYNLNLYDLKYSDCGTYKCLATIGEKTYDLKIIEPLRDIELQETATEVTITTSCVTPASSVDIRWFYIYQDETPRAYENPASRDDDVDVCSGSCIENNAVKISSSQKFSYNMKHSIPVKIMAYVRQGDKIMMRTTLKEYFIESCPSSPRTDIICTLILLLLCILLLVIFSIHHQRRHDEIFIGKVYIVSVSGIMLIILVSCIILLAVNEPETPDIFGRCDDRYTTNMTVTGISYILIIILGLVLTVYTAFLRDLKTCDPLKARWKERQNNKLDDRKVEEQVHLTQGDIEDTSTSTRVKSPEELKTDMEEQKRLADEQLAKDKEQEGDIKLDCVPAFEHTDEIQVHVGDLAILKFHGIESANTEYPSWEKINGNVINTGGKAQLKDKDKRISWNDDKKSIRIENVQEEDAGTYACFLPDGNIFTVKLVIILSTEDVDVDLDKDAVLRTGDQFKRIYPHWRRWNNLNAELHEQLREENLRWDTDNKGLIVRNVHEKDEGLYEVFSNGLIKRFRVSVNKQTDAKECVAVEEGKSISLECSSKIDYYPAWECQNSDVYNIATKEDFRVNKKSNIVKRLKWSVDKRSLVITNIKLQDTGTYLCRHSNGTVETITVTVKSKPEEIQKKDNAIKIHHKLDRKYPSIKLEGAEKNESPELIAYQNFSTKLYTPDGHMDKGSIKLPSKGFVGTAEVSIFGGCVKVYNVS